MSTGSERGGDYGARLPQTSGVEGTILRSSRADFVPPLLRLGPAARIVVPGSMVALCSGLFLNGYDSAWGRVVFGLVCAAMLALVAAAYPPPLRAWRDARWPLGCIAAALGWLCVLQLTAERFAPDLFLPEMIARLGGVAALLAGYVLGQRRGVDRRVLGWLVALCCLSLVTGWLLSVASPDLAVFGRTVVRKSRLSGLIGNSNVTAAVAGIAVLLSFHRFLRASAYGKTVSLRDPSLLIHGGAMLVAAACQLSTGARVTSLLTLALAGAIAWQDRRSDRGALPGRRRGLVLGALLATLAAVVLSFGGVVADRIGDLDRSSAVRQLMWGRYLDAALRRPFVGYGPGSFPTLNAMFQPDPFNAQATWSAQSAHDLPIQLLLVGGLPYALLLGVAAGLILRQMVRGWRGWHPPRAHAGVLAAALLIAAAAMFDIALDVPVTIGLFCFLVGTSWGAARRAVVGVANPERAPAQQE